MSITGKESVDIIREYLEEERANIQKLAKDKETLPLARELDRVVDNVERRCRIIECK